MAKHHLYSASSAYRWLVCRGSVAATQQAMAEGKIKKERSDSIDSLTGTCAHWLLEKSLLLDIHPKRFLNRRHGGIRVNLEMVGHIQDIIVWLKKQIPSGGKLYTEKRYRNLRARFDLDIGGTVDIVIVGPGVLKIFDLKYGTWYVDHNNNPQINFYSLAAYLKYKKEYKIRSIFQGILQPRSFMSGEDTNRVVKITPKKLLRWERYKVLPAIKEIKTGNPQLTAGDHCRYCSIEVICTEQGQYLIEVAQTEFKSLVKPLHTLPNVKSLSPDKLAALVTHQGQFIRFFKAVKEHVNHLVLTGSMVHDDLKVVKKNRSTEYTKTQQKIIADLKRKNVPSTHYLTEQKLLSHGILKANLTAFWGNSSKANRFINQTTTVQENGFTVVPTTDRRKEVEIETAEGEFAEFVVKPED